MMMMTVDCISCSINIRHIPSDSTDDDDDDNGSAMHPGLLAPGAMVQDRGEQRRVWC